MCDFSVLDLEAWLGQTGRRTNGQSAVLCIVVNRPLPHNAFHHRSDKQCRSADEFCVVKKMLWNFSANLCIFCWQCLYSNSRCRWWRKLRTDIGKSGEAVLTDRSTLPKRINPLRKIFLYLLPYCYFDMLSYPYICHGRRHFSNHL